MCNFWIESDRMSAILLGQSRNVRYVILKSVTYRWYPVKFPSGSLCTLLRKCRKNPKLFSSYLVTCVCSRASFPFSPFLPASPPGQTSTISAAGNTEMCQREMLSLCDIAFTDAYSNLVLNLLAYFFFLKSLFIYF